jgi:ferredoxin--NADP+ reductase
MKLNVRSVLDLSKGNFILKVERPKNLQFNAGQYFSISIPHLGVNREYSVSSGREEEDLEFFIREIDEGTLSPNLRKLDKSMTVSLNGPYGEFTLDENYMKKKLLFVASGTGVAPFKSFIKSYNNLNYTLLHGVRYFEDLNINLIDKNRIIPCVSRENGATYKRVTNYLTNEDLSKFDQFYLCGNKSMITDTIGILLKKKISTNSIFMETYF